MIVFVTGASGHLGANVVRQLLDAGHHVRALCRAQSSNTALQGLALERVHGDLDNPGPLAEALEGCDALLHLAAFVSVREVDARAMIEANVHATRALMQIARRVGVRRVVHCSSIGTVGRRPDGTCDEDLFPDPLEPIMPYDRTKLLAELEVFRAASLGLDACILNPTGLIGPYDFKPSLIGKTILDFAHGRLPAYVQGGYDFVSVTDTARAHLLALENGRRGERYILSGEFLELGQLLRWLAELTGRTVPRWAIPPELILPWAGLKDWVDRTLTPTRVPRFTKHSIQLLKRPKHPSNQHAREVLGWAPGPVYGALEAAVRWFQEQGRIQPTPPT